MGIVQGHGINDMPWGWASENEWNKMVYRKWHGMFVRCYSEEYHKTHPSYIGCTVCDRWLILSNFVEDVPKIDGYDRDKFLNGELALDKDIKSGGTNKQYIIEECLLTTQEENTKEAMRTREYNELSEEHKQKLSEAQKGKHHTEETKQKISDSLQGRILSEETKQKMRKPKSEEHKQKMSENNAMKGKFGSECPNSKKVAQYDKKTNELIKIWDSMHDVERELGINQGNVSSCCKGSRKTAGGFIWRYVKE